MGEILSHAEVEAILSAIELSRPKAGPTVEVSASAVVPEAWERHDFRRPEVLRGEALDFVHALHGGICQRWQVRLQSLLQEPIDVRPVGACQSTGTEFLASIASPHVICQIGHAGSAAESLLVWSAELVQSLFGRMLGDTGVHGSTPHPMTNNVRPMTNIELRLLGRLNDAVLGELAILLNDKLGITAVLPDDSERIAQFPCVWFSFEVDYGGLRGLIHLAISGMSFNAGLRHGELAPGLTAVETIPSGIHQVRVEVSANLGSLRLKTSDLLALQVGDIVMTDLSPSQTVSLQLEGRNLSQATIGTHLGRKALRLSANPAPPQGHLGK